MAPSPYRDKLERDQALDVERQVDLGRGLVPEDVGLDELLHEDPGDGEHGPAGVDALGLGEPREGLGVGAEAQGVEAVVGGEAAVFGLEGRVGFGLGGKGKESKGEREREGVEGEFSFSLFSDALFFSSSGFIIAFGQSARFSRENHTST